MSTIEFTRVYNNATIFAKRGDMQCSHDTACHHKIHRRRPLTFHQQLPSVNTICREPVESSATERFSLPLITGYKPAAGRTHCNDKHSFERGLVVYSSVPFTQLTHHYHYIQKLFFNLSVFLAMGRYKNTCCIGIQYVSKKNE